MTKYRNKKTVLDGISFDSKAEAHRYAELRLLERAGEITELKRQVRFELVPKSAYGRALYYVADFTYIEHGEQVVEDVKSTATKTRLYQLKKRLLGERYGIRIREVYGCG